MLKRNAAGQETKESVRRGEEVYHFTAFTRFQLTARSRSLFALAELLSDQSVSDAKKEITPYLVFNTNSPISTTKYELKNCNK